MMKIPIAKAQEAGRRATGRGTTKNNRALDARRGAGEKLP